MEKLPDREVRKEEIIKLIDEAKKHALEEDEFLKLLDKRDALMRQPLTSESIDEMKKMDEVLDKSKVAVKNLPDFKTLLELTVKDEKVRRDTLAHENAHGNVADSVGMIHFEYSMHFVKIGDKWNYMLSTSAGFPSFTPMTEEERLKKEIAFTEAPKTFGEDMSTHDEEATEDLRRQLRELEGE